MNILIKEATILCPDSPHHKKVVDLHIQNGIIHKIGKGLDVTSAKILACPDLYVTIGLCDLGTHGGEPGYEHRETMQSLTKAALAGGFTELVLSPALNPVTQHKSQLEFLAGHPDRNGVTIHPAGALSVDLKGQDLAEMADMKQHGAVAFTDGLRSVQDSGFMSRSLQYASQLGVTVLHHPLDKALASGGEVHEGPASTSLGLKGMPEIAEWNQVQRDLMLADIYLPNGDSDKKQLVFHGISSGRSVNMISDVRQKTDNIGVTVPYLNLLFTDEDLLDFDTHKKVTPVLRGENSRKELCEALKFKKIDAIISNHVPLDMESKQVEFSYAAFGAAGLETCLSACVDALLEEVGLDTIVDALTRGPRQLLGLPVPVLATANICAFSTSQPWQFHASKACSKAVNYPWDGHLFRTKVVLTVNELVVVGVEG
ncbi:MAG: dihydroorotase [Saprospiraceae bacterium]|nr:dihydroorotase [Saprospiraceae bacterium]